MLELELNGKCYGKNNIIKIDKGITCLTGPNGCGKSYACKQIIQYLENNNIPHYEVDVYKTNKDIGDCYVESR